MVFGGHVYGVLAGGLCVLRRIKVIESVKLCLLAEELAEAVGILYKQLPIRFTGPGGI